MAMGKRRPRPKQTWMWVATQDLPRSAAHPFYTRLNQILDEADFDGYVESLCQRFYADEIGRPGLPPGRYFRSGPKSPKLSLHLARCGEIVRKVFESIELNVGHQTG